MSWKSIKQNNLDYCSQLWSPAGQSSIARLESVARHFNSPIDGMEIKNYLERFQDQDPGRKTFHCPLIYNCIPLELRNMVATVKKKAILEACLSTVPDEPLFQVVPGLLSLTLFWTRQGLNKEIPSRVNSNVKHPMTSSLNMSLNE